MPHPIVSHELLQLTNQDIDAASIRFKNVTMQSSRWVCVREEGKASVCILDTATKTFVRLPVMADSAIMSPTERVIALRAGLNLQIFDLDQKARMKNAAVPSEVVFWKFTDPNTIVLVTASHVYTWAVYGEGSPVKLFDRQAHAGAQIINYRASADGKWHILGGIAVAPSGGVAGILQVYSAEMKASQPQMDALAACFVAVTLEGRSAPSTLFCFAKQTEQGLKVTAIEVGVPKDSAFQKSGIIKLPAGDFPVGMLPDNKTGMVFVVSKMGVMALFEIQSGQCLYTSNSSSTMFLQIESDSPEGGILTVDSAGRVHHHFVDERGLIAHVADTLHDAPLAADLSRRLKVPEAVAELDFSGSQKLEPEPTPGKAPEKGAVTVDLAARPADPFAVLAEGSIPPSPSRPSLAPPRASVVPAPPSPVSAATLVDFDDNSIISVGQVPPLELNVEQKKDVPIIIEASASVELPTSPPLEDTPFIPAPTPNSATPELDPVPAPSPNSMMAVPREGIRFMSMSSQEVGAWLRDNGLDQYEDKFAEKQMGGESLAALAFGARQNALAATQYLVQELNMYPGHALKFVAILLRLDG